VVGSKSARQDPQAYSGTLAARLWRLAPRRLAALAAVCALSLGAGACSFSYDLSSFTSKGSDKTGTVAASGRAKAADKATAGDDLPPAADLVFARAAVHEVLARGDNDSSQPWENPESGARGTVTPLTAAYSHEGFLCRDFLASYVRQGNEAWLQGEACRVHKGKWEVKNLRPWKRT
jgi:surface antigen